MDKEVHHRLMPIDANGGKLQEVVAEFTLRVVVEVPLDDLVEDLHAV